MIELGKRQVLKVVKKVDFGVYLGEAMGAGEKERVLLGLLEEAVDLGASDGHGWWYLPESHGTRWSPRARARRHRGRRW